jgi:hypothetical protein
MLLLGSADYPRWTWVTSTAPLITGADHSVWTKRSDGETRLQIRRGPARGISDSSPALQTSRSFGFPRGCAGTPVPDRDQPSQRGEGFSPVRQVGLCLPPDTRRPNSGDQAHQAAGEAPRAHSAHQSREVIERCGVDLGLQRLPDYADSGLDFHRWVRRVFRGSSTAADRGSIIGRLGGDPCPQPLRAPLRFESLPRAAGWQVRLRPVPSKGGR